MSVLRADRHAVNSVARHPTRPYAFASCGIDASAKLWAPLAPSPRALGPAVLARLAENELKRAAAHAGSAAGGRARDLGLGPGGWAPGGGVAAGQYLVTPPWGRGA